MRTAPQPPGSAPRRVLSKPLRFVLGAAALLAVAGLIGAARLWLGSAPRAEPAAPCASAGDRLQGVWDAPRKAQIRAAFTAAQLPYAAQTGSAVEREIDAYASAWQTYAVGLCRASQALDPVTHPEVDVRAFCLERGVRRLDAFVRALVAADAPVIQAAAEAAAELPPVSDCPELSSRLRAPPDGQHARVDAARLKLAGLSAVANLERPQQVLEAVRSLEQETRELISPPLEAERLLLEGTLQARSGDERNAEKTLRRAVLAAEAGRDDAAAAQAWMELIAASANKEDALEAGRHAEALVQALDAPAHLTMQLLTRRGIWLWGQGKYSEALGQLQQALHLAEQLYPPDSPLLASALSNVGLVLKEQGSHEQAFSFLKQGLEIGEKSLGPDNPRLASTLNRMGLILYEEGRYREALEYHRRGLALREAGFPADDPAVGAALLNVAQDLDTLGEHKEAMRLIQRSLDIHRKAFGDLHLRTVGAVQVLQMALVRQGRYDEAIVQGRRALEILDKRVGQDSELRAGFLSTQADAYRGQRRWAEARGLYHRAVALRQADAGLYSPLLVKDLTREAEMALAQGRPRDAVPLLERALKLGDAEVLPPEQQGSSRFLLAQALWGLGERVRSCGLAKDARAAFARSSVGDADRAAVDAWRAYRRRCP